MLWSAGKGPLRRDRNAAEVFAYLRFGQPSVTRLRDGRLLFCFWYQNDGQYKVAVREIDLDLGTLTKARKTRH